MSWPTAIGALLGLCVLLYMAVLAWLWRNQERLLFAPTVLPPHQVLAHEPDVRELAIEVPGARLSALHLQRPDARGLVFFLHGNAGALDTWFVNLDYYRRANLDLFMLDYRGFGKSTGRIESEAQLRADVRAAWDAVAPLYAHRQRIVYGRSLGSGLAAGLAAELSATRPPDLTILVSPYTSLAAMAAEQYPWVPSFVLRYPMRTDRLVARIRGPVLLIHAENDTLIRAHHPEALQALLPRATLLRVPGAAHGDVHEFDVYLEGLRKALALP